MHVVCILHASYLRDVCIPAALPCCGNHDNLCQRLGKIVTSSPLPYRGLPCLRFPRNAGSHSGNALEGIRCRSVFFPLITIPKFFCCGGGCGVVVNPLGLSKRSLSKCLRSIRRVVQQARQIHRLGGASYRSYPKGYIKGRRTI